MATIYEIHPETPQTRQIEEIKDALRSGAVMLYPTDTVYAIGCDLNVKAAVERVRRIKQLSNDKPLTFLCSSLSNISSYAYVTNEAYRVLKRLIPGPYTFLLPATKLVPKLVMNPKRKTTGIRVPDSAICQALLTTIDTPIVSTSALSVFEADQDYTAKAELFDRFESLVDVIVDDGLELQHHLSTVLDLTTDEPMLLRKGRDWQAAAAWATEALSPEAIS
jgi:tRNA threonylcarbamoyl adenosine modification protein (Sua5/YciO/YrdC/YwlC family)